MFNITPSELLTIAVIALVVFGPKRVIEMARKAGQVTGQLRRTAEELTSGLKAEIDSVSEPLRDLTQPLREMNNDLAAAGKKVIETPEGELQWVDDDTTATEATPAGDPAPEEPVGGDSAAGEATAGEATAEEEAGEATAEEEAGESGETEPAPS